MKRFELRDIQLKTGNKKGDSVQFDVLKANQLKSLLDHHRGDFIDLGLAIYKELLYSLKVLETEVPEYKGDASMKTRDLWSKALKKLSSTKNTTKELRRNAFKSIHIRNKYAHGKLGFVNNEPFLTYDNEDGGEVSSLSNTLLLTKASQK